MTRRTLLAAAIGLPDPPRRKRRGPTPESIVLRSVLTYLALCERAGLGWWWRNSVGAMRTGDRFLRWGEPGQPDVMGMLAGSGRFVGIECKAEAGRLSDSQRTWRDRCLASGGIWLEARSVDDVRAGLTAQGVRAP